MYAVRQDRCVECRRPSRSRCDCLVSGGARRRRRRTAVCPTGQCSGRHVRRAAVVASAASRPRCRNGGTSTGGVCLCRDGFFGDRCQLRDPCSQQPCRNGGYCRSLVDLTGLQFVLLSHLQPCCCLLLPPATTAAPCRQTVGRCVVGHVTRLKLAETTILSTSFFR